MAPGTRLLVPRGSHAPLRVARRRCGVGPQRQARQACALCPCLRKADGARSAMAEGCGYCVLVVFSQVSVQRACSQLCVVSIACVTGVWGHNVLG